MVQTFSVSVFSLSSSLFFNIPGTQRGALSCSQIAQHIKSAFEIHVSAFDQRQRPNDGAHEFFFFYFILDAPLEHNHKIRIPRCA